MQIFKGTCSWFGGPDDVDGVAPDEGLAFIYELDDAPDLFLPVQPRGTTGLARRLDPEEFYIACRWDYDITSKEDLLNLRVLVRAPKTGKHFIARPADWGPHEEKTGRAADLSPGLMGALGIETDDEVQVFVPAPGRVRTPIAAAPLSIVISAGHGLKIRGASGYLDEVDEARRVVPEVAANLRARGCRVVEVYDDVSTTQQANLEWLVAAHDAEQRDLDLSIHFNASDGNGHGTEVLYLTQEDLASDISAAIAAAGELTDRGPKYRNNLYWLNNTDMPACLVEVAFCDHEGDCASYQENFEAICDAIAGAVAPAAVVVADDD